LFELNGPAYGTGLLRSAAPAKSLYIASSSSLSGFSVSFIIIIIHHINYYRRFNIHVRNGLFWSDEDL
jgi:hypothetical protein